MNNKRSFVQRRTTSTKVQSRHRLSEGEEPLNSHNLLMVPSDDGSPRMTRASLSMSPPSPRQQHLSDIVHCNSQSVDNLPGGSGQWDSSAASSRSGSSMDLLSGSCDSLGNTTMEPNKTCGSPVIQGQSSVIKVSSEDKKHVIRNLANLTSLEVVGSNKEGNERSSCSNDLTIASSTEVTQHSLENITEETHPQGLSTEQPHSSVEQPHPLAIEQPLPTVPHSSLEQPHFSDDRHGKTWSLQSNASAQSIGEKVFLSGAMFCWPYRINPRKLVWIGNNSYHKSRCLQGWF